MAAQRPSLSLAAQAEQLTTTLLNALFFCRSYFFSSPRDRKENREVPWKIRKSTRRPLNDVLGWNGRNHKSWILEVNRVLITAPHTTPRLPCVAHVPQRLPRRAHQVKCIAEFVS